MTQSEPTIVYASADESANDILERIGVKTIREPGQPIRWHYKGKTVFRPEYVNYFESELLEHFNIKIEYQDKNQLSMFEG